MRRLLYPNKTLCMCVERNRVPVLFDSVSHWNQTAGTHCISIIWSQIALFTVLHCCDLYALQGHIIFVLYFLCSRYLCVYTALSLCWSPQAYVLPSVCVCVCQSVCCVHEYLVRLYVFCVCALIFMAQVRFADMLAAVCCLRAVIANQDTGNITTCHPVPTWPLIPCVWKRPSERERKRKGKLQLFWCCANYYLLQWCKQRGVFIL